VNNNRSFETMLCWNISNSFKEFFFCVLMIKSGTHLWVSFNSFRLLFFLFYLNFFLFFFNFLTFFSFLTFDFLLLLFLFLFSNFFTFIFSFFLVFNLIRCQLVLQIESIWKLEIKLNSSTLMFSFQCIVKLDINFWSVKCTITWIYFPRSSKFIQSFSQLCFCFIPSRHLTKIIFWSSWQKQNKLKSKHIINIVQKLQAV